MSHSRECMVLVTVTLDPPEVTQDYFNKKRGHQKRGVWKFCSLAKTKKFYWPTRNFQTTPPQQGNTREVQ